ncbi:SLAM family member 8-like isoform X2 [Hippocampus zosterae]|uniref:SLAM family member 8-like isoform X2 n=1 Tax=Hippocampus zosterae TaxID=109293 RepID=UPI00223CDC29|nr:SLAM family member 8-like isoform X2 [Hippocampus zosterae]
MVAGGLRDFLCFGGAWLLLAGLREAAGCQRVIHGRAGEAAELAPCLPGRDVTFARWSFGGRKVAEADDDEDGARGSGRFAGRLRLDRRNFSLTLGPLTPDDSGVYSFVSAVNDSQRETVTVTLRVHEAIVAAPVVSVNASRRAGNRSCSVLLRCSASAGGGPVEYEWRVGNRSLSGAWLSVSPRGAAAEVTCTVFNAVSAKSISASVSCDDAAASARGRTREEATVYADIGEVTAPYVSVRAAEQRSPPAPVQTLYDTVQLDRVAVQGRAP